MMDCGWCGNAAVLLRSEFPLCSECAQRDATEQAEFASWLDRWDSDNRGSPRVYEVLSQPWTEGDWYAHLVAEKAFEFRFVRTTSKRRAMVLAMRSWRRQGVEGLRHWEDNPFHGMKAYRMRRPAEVDTELAPRRLAERLRGT